MKKTTTGLVALLTALGMTLFLGVGSAAAACVERDAYVEVITAHAVTDTVFHPAETAIVHHDAVVETVIDQEAYTETVVDEEAYTETVVDEEAYTETIEHPAVTHVVHHDAVTEEQCKTKFQYQKQTKTVVRHGNGNSAPILVSDWSWWSPASLKWSTQDVEVLESGDHANWTQQHGGHVDYFDRDYRYVKNGVTEQYDCQTVVVEEAYDETVVDEEAWTETIEHPAVTHDVFHEAVTHDVFHEATYKDVVVKEAYDEEVIVTESYYETVVVTPAQRERVRHAAVQCASPPLEGRVPPSDKPELPNTGGPNVALAGLGLLLVAGGALLLLRRRRA